jgi:hypothetical protein
VFTQGHRLSADVRDVPLQPGDVLLLDTGSSFPKRFKDDRTFSIIKGVNDTSPVKTNRMWIAIGLATVMIGTQVKLFPWSESFSLPSCQANCAVWFIE